jgi:hypothetical protein
MSELMSKLALALMWVMAREASVVMKWVPALTVLSAVA